ncbi:MAG: hypothetical protein LBC09_02610 [Helicobacteraceae bacterium]|jgi:hypothetical protein|nr:hypothetical protein [Helicobacteraceae bacterium]
MSLIRLFVAISIAFSALFAAEENPSPLGLQIGAATIADAKAKYRLKSVGVNRYSEGEQFNIELGSVNMDNVKEASIIFDKNGKLAYVGLEFTGDKFNSLYESLSGKYTTRSKQIPFVGNKSAVFSAGGSEIRLSKPHMSFDTSLHYGATWLWEKFENAVHQEQNAKKKAEESQL